MKLVYMTLRKKQIPSIFRSLVYPAILDWLELPSNHRVIQKDSLLEALQDARVRGRRAQCDVVIFTAGTGHPEAIVQALLELPANFTVYLAAIEETGDRNITKLKRKVSQQEPEAAIRDIRLLLVRLESANANDIVDMLKGGYSRN